MATNKQAAIRYRILDRCLGNPAQRFTFEELRKRCNEALMEIYPDHTGISVRTLREDIRHLRSPEGGNAPIETFTTGQKTYYRYGQKDYSIYNQSLNAAEVEQLRVAVETLSKVEGLPQFAWLSELKAKLEESFFLENVAQPIMSYDNNRYLKGIDFLGQLFQSILYKKVLCITYKSFKSETERKFILHPYHLREYNNRWFLFGRNNGFNNLTNLALDRIIDIKEEVEIDFLENDRWDFNEYFEDIIGVSVTNGTLEKIVLSFNSAAAPYVLSKPLHGSQRIVSRADDKLVVSIEVYPNYELESLILSFGERVEVLKPQAIRDQIMTRVKDMMTEYQSI